MSNQNYLRKYFEAFPLKNIFFSEDGLRAFFIEETTSGERVLKGLDCKTECKTETDDAVLRIEDAELLSPENFAGRAIVPAGYSARFNRVFFLLDQANEEKYNLYSLDLDLPFSARRLKQLTQVEHALSPKITDSEIWFLNRQAAKEKGQFNTSLCSLDLATQNVKTYGSDETWDYKLNYATVRPYGENTVVAFLDLKGQRQKLQLFSIDLQSWNKEPLLPDSMISNGNWFAARPITNDIVYFQSNVSGFENIYEINLETRALKQVTNLKEKNNCGVISDGENPVVFVSTEDLKKRTTTTILSTLGHDILFKEESLGEIVFISLPQALWVRQTSMTTGSLYRRLHPSPRAQFAPTQADMNELIHCTREALSYKSFDGLEIPALLFMPRGKLKGALIISFYGGNDTYSQHYQMFLEHGIAVLSPAVRGSWGWPKAWEDLIRGDLGGNEILDVIWGARLLRDRLKLPENRIIVEGGSHGGYATLRTMTFPNPYSGFDTSFNFAGGICWAGFADLVKFYEDSWISDWLVDFLGPFDEAKYRDRSPVQHMDKLRGPLYISHGANDRRVPISTITECVEKLPKTPYKHRVIVQDGEGHGAAGVENEIKHLAQMFDTINEWLESVDSVHASN